MDVILYKLELICRTSNIVEEFESEIRACHNPTIEMQSIADNISIVLQDLEPRLKKLCNLHTKYREEFQNVCQHNWIEDDFEQISGDSSIFKKVRYCMFCEKQKD